jgi:hypothetical protein
MDIPEPHNTGTDLAQHAYALAHHATVMTAYVGDSPSERVRRNIKRYIREPSYDQDVCNLLSPDVSSIYHHQRGSVIYLNRPERIADDGDRLTAYNMTHQRAAKAMLALACARGWTSIVFNGPHDFIVAAMREAIAQGMPVHPRDSGQRQILEQIMAESSGAMGTVSVPMTFVPPTEPSFPHEDMPEPDTPVPAAPEVPSVPLNDNLATKLALRRQQKAPSDESPANPSTNSKGPKGP